MGEKEQEESTSRDGPTARVRFFANPLTGARGWYNRIALLYPYIIASRRRPRSSLMPPIPLFQVAVHLRPEDNVAIAARPLQPGQEFQFDGAVFTVSRRVGLGHKIAVRPIAKGEAVRKYGQIIGFASADIATGDHVHVHNLSADAFERDYAFCRDCPPPLPPPATPCGHFMGYDRGDGRYGTRNYIALISTVNCSASTSKYISERFRATDLLQRYPNVDGVVADHA